MPDRLNKVRLGKSEAGDTVEILASHTENGTVKVHFYAPDLEQGGNICLEPEQAWHFASDVIASAIKLDPEFIPNLMDDLATRMKILDEKQQELS